MRDCECYLYVIATVFQGKPSAPVKIGISSNVESRLRSIKTTCPYEITLLHFFRLPDRRFAQFVEGLIHTENRAHRGNGEWFSISPRQALIEACCAILSFCYDDEELAERVEEWMAATRLSGAFDMMKKLANVEAPQPCQ